MQKYGFLLFGTVFGFILSRAGATTYDFYAKLFLFEDMQLLWVIAVAGGVGILGMQMLKSVKAKAVLDGSQLQFQGKSNRPGLIPGSLIFGLGWGLASACPGTVLAMLGEGKLAALFTIIGIVVGTYLYGLQMSMVRNNAEAVSQQTGALET